jgi:hypothetical protein
MICGVSCWTHQVLCTCCCLARKYDTQSGPLEHRFCALTLRNADEMQRHVVKLRFSYSHSLPSTEAEQSH